jgi:hypothetical protein
MHSCCNHSTPQDSRHESEWPDAMRILFFDMSFHRHTRSSYFFSDLLEGRGEVVRMWDERWEGGPAADPTPWENSSVDVAVFWQLLLPPAELLQLQYRSLVWVPMWDALHNVPDVALRPFLIVKPRVLCFCRVLYERLSGMGFNCLCTKYFPTLPEEPVRAREGISVYFSQRRNTPNWETVKRLLGDEATANEYIVSGTNGILYPSEAPRAIDLSMAATLGKVSRETVRQGRKAWIEDIDKVMSFVHGE